MARKALVGTVAENVQRHGTGGINVEVCRLDARKQQQKQGRYQSSMIQICGSDNREAIYPADLGRWPANVCLDEEAAAMLDKQSGECPSGIAIQRNGGGGKIYGSQRGQGMRNDDWGYQDSGGASRFFYVAKASRAEREEGCRFLPLRTAGEATDRGDGANGLNSPHDYYSGAWPASLRPGAGRGTRGRNFHPTVKPIELMRWLVRLVTPPGGTVLDPFAGSGTTGIACDLEGFDFIGIELDPEYAQIAQARLDYWRAIPKQMNLP